MYRYFSAFGDIMETSIWREHGCASVFFCFILKLYPHVSCLTLYFLPLSGSLPFLLLTCLLSAYCAFICSDLSCVSLSHLPLVCFPPFGSCFLGFIYCLYFVLLYFSVISCLVIALLLLSFGLRFSSLFNKAPTCMCVFAFGSHFVESDKHIEHYARCIYVCLSVHLSVDRFRQGTSILIM